MMDSTRYWAPTGVKLTSTAFAGWSRGGAMGRPQPDNLVSALNDYALNMYYKKCKKIVRIQEDSK